MGKKKSPPPPPPPQIVLPPPPPPATVFQDVTPRETYQDATDYLARLDAREEAIEKRRWDAGETPGNIRASHAGINLADAELANQLDQSTSFPGTPSFGSQAGTNAVINALAAKPVSGSSSRQARIRPQNMTAVQQGRMVTGPEARLAKAQEAYWLAQRAKDEEKFSYPEFVEPSWADRDWYPVVDKWKERSDKVEVGDNEPRIIST
jgi:hypothetical protein